MNKNLLVVLLTFLSLMLLPANALSLSDISPVVFQKEMSTRPKTLYAEVQLSSRYAGAFRDKRETHVAVKIVAFNSDMSTDSVKYFYGYAQNSRKLGKTLSEALKDGERHPAKVKMHFEKGASRNDVVVIDDIEFVLEEDKRFN